MKDDNLSNGVLVSSLISNRNQTPRVDITFENGQRIQMEAEAAIRIALDIIQCAYGAYIDSFLYNFVLEKVFKGADKDIAASIVTRDFREYREKLELEFKAMQEKH